MGKQHGRKENKPAKPVIKLFKSVVNQLLQDCPQEALALLRYSLDVTAQVVKFEDEHNLSIAHHAVQAMLAKQPDQRPDYVPLIEALYQDFSYKESGDTNGVTPLMHLCKSHDSALLEKMVPYMRPLRTLQQHTIAHHLITHHHIRPLKALLDSASPEHKKTIVRPDAPIPHPLLLAAELQNIEIVTLLLEHGADPLCTDQYQNTPLMKALIHSEDRPACVDALLPHIQDERKHRPILTGGSLFHMACELGYRNIVGSLLAHGVDPNQTDLRGELPIHTAITHGWPEITKLLLAVTANLDTPSPKGWNLLHYSVFYKHAKVTEILLQNFIKSVTTVMMTQAKQQQVVVQPIVYAVRNYDIPNTKLLAQYGVDLDICFDKPIQACHWRYQTTNLLSLLDTAGTLHTNPAHRDSGHLADWTLLHEACAHNRHPIAEILLQHGASFHHTTDNSITALMLAIVCYDNNSKTIQTLLAKGADPNAITTDGRATPLTLAIRKGAAELVHLLLAHKANPDKMVCSKISPLALAYHLKQESCLALLLSCSLKTQDFVQSLSGNLPQKIAAISPKQPPVLDPKISACDRVMLIDAHLKATESSLEDMQPVILSSSAALPQIPKQIFLKDWNTLKEVFVAKLSQYYAQCQLYQAIQSQSSGKEKSALNPDSLFVQLYTVDHPLISKLLGCGFLASLPQDTHWPKRLFNRLIPEALYSSILTTLKQVDFTQLAQNLDHAEHNEYPQLQSYWLAVMASYPTPPCTPDLPLLSEILTETFWDKLIHINLSPAQASHTTAAIITRYAWFTLLANHAPTLGILGKICDKQLDLFVSFRTEYEKKLDADALTALPHMPKLSPQLSLVENRALQGQALLHSLCVVLPHLVALSQDPKLADVRALAKVPFHLVKHFPQKTDKVSILLNLITNIETQAPLLLDYADIQWAVLDCLSSILTHRSLFSYATEAEPLRACLGKIERCMDGFVHLTHEQQVGLASYCLHRDIPSLSHSTHILLKTFYHAHHHIRTAISQELTQDNDQSNQMVQEMLLKYQNLLHQAQEKEMNQQEFITLRQAHTSQIDKIKQNHQKELELLKTQAQEKLATFDQDFQQQLARSQEKMLQQSERLEEIEKETLAGQKIIERLEQSNKSLRANQQNANKTIASLEKTLADHQRTAQSELDRRSTLISNLTTETTTMEANQAILSKKLDAQAQRLAKQADELTQSSADYDALMQAHNNLHAQLRNQDSPVIEKLQRDLAAMRSQMETQIASSAREKQALSHQRNALQVEREALDAERKALAEQRKAQDTERETLADQRLVLDAERKALAEQRKAQDAENNLPLSEHSPAQEAPRIALTKRQQAPLTRQATIPMSQHALPEGGDTSSLSSLSSDITQDPHAVMSCKTPNSTEPYACNPTRISALNASIHQLMALINNPSAFSDSNSGSKQLASGVGLFSSYCANTQRTLQLTVQSLETERLFYTGLDAPTGLRQHFQQLHSVLQRLATVLPQQECELGLCGSTAANWLFSLLNHAVSGCAVSDDIDLYISAPSQQYDAIRAAVNTALEPWRRLPAFTLDYTHARHSRLVTVTCPWLAIDIHFFSNNKPLQVTDTRFCWHSDLECFSLPARGLSQEHNDFYLGVVNHTPGERIRQPSLFRALCFGADLYTRFASMHKSPASLSQLITQCLQDKIANNQQPTLVQDCVSLLEKTMYTQQAPYAWFFLTQPYGDDDRTLLQLALSRDVTLDQYDIDYFQSTLVPMQVSNLHKICVLFLTLAYQKSSTEQATHQVSFTSASAPDQRVTLTLGKSPRLSGLDHTSKQFIFDACGQWQEVRKTLPRSDQEGSLFSQAFVDTNLSHSPYRR